MVKLISKIALLALMSSGCGKASSNKQSAETTTSRPDEKKASEEIVFPVLSVQDRESILTGVGPDKSVTIHLLVQGSSEDLNKFAFECRFARAVEILAAKYGPCNAAMAHQVWGLKAGEVYTLAARPVHIESKKTGPESGVSFVLPVENIVAIKVANRAEILDKNHGRYDVKFEVKGNYEDVVCTIGSIPVNCMGGTARIDLDDFNGPGQLTIAAIGPLGDVLYQDVIDFCAGDLCYGHPLILEELSLGKFYTIKIPNDMHVLSYTTDKTLNGDDLQTIGVVDDPYAFPQNCLPPARVFQMETGEGRPYAYCERYHNVDQAYREVAGFDRGLNSIEFSTRWDDLEAYERFAFSSFEDPNEVIPAVTRFDTLCRSSFDLSPEMEVKAIREWYGNNNNLAKVQWCKTIIGPSSPLGNLPLEVWVASFTYVRPAEVALQKDNKVEFIYIAGAGAIDSAFRDEKFIRKALERILATLDSTGLNEKFAETIN